MSDRKFDPRQPYKVCLPDFDDVPVSERPSYTYRRVSGSQFFVLQDALDSVGNESDASYRDRVGILYDACRMGLVDWDNQIDLDTGEPLPFDAAKLEQTMDHFEVMRLLQRRMQHASISADDKKKSAS